MWMAAPREGCARPVPAARREIELAQLAKCVPLVRVRNQMRAPVERDVRAESVDVQLVKNVRQAIGVLGR